MKRLLGLLFAVLLLASCTSRMESGFVQGVGDIMVSATCVDTKSVLTSDLDVVWNAEDRITVLSLDGAVSVVSDMGSSNCSVIISSPSL